VVPWVGFHSFNGTGTAGTGTEGVVEFALDTLKIRTEANPILNKIALDGSGT
jgi:hypothetical protein